MYGNIYYDNEMNYKPIDWENEYIKMVDDNGHVSLQRIYYVAYDYTEYHYHKTPFITHLLSFLFNWR